LKIAGHAPYENRFSVGVRKDDPQLLAVFQKAVASLLSAERDVIVNRWVDPRITREVDTSLFWKIFVVLGVILLLLLYRQVMLSRLNSSLQKAHQAVRLEKERAERALLAEQEAIHQNVRFVDMVGHEYRTPVSIISANLDILEMKAEQSRAPRPPQVVKMRNAVDRLVELIESALDKVRSADASITLAKEILDLAEVLTEVIGNTRENHPSRQLSMGRYSGSPCLVSADLVLLKTAFANLLDNALKYSDAESEVEIHLLPCQGYFEVMILDRGVGIPPAEQNQVCEKYWRATNASHVSGAGIGLYLVRKIIRLHNGSLQLASRQGGGTTVTVKLPEAKHSAC
jgi:signal transduction histidine kinase